MTRQIMELRDHLISERVSLVVMEATGDYWKPFYYLFEDAGFETMLVNARHVRTLPGRKTDVSDSVWLAQLGAHGLVRGSLVPPAPVRELRDLTRTRVSITRERSREIQRLESCSRTPASICPRWRPTSSACPVGRCSRRWSPGSGTPRCWPS